MHNLTNGTVCVAHMMDTWLIAVLLPHLATPIPCLSPPFFILRFETSHHGPIAAWSDLPVPSAHLQDHLTSPKGGKIPTDLVASPFTKTALHKASRLGHSGVPSRRRCRQINGGATSLQARATTQCIHFRTWWPLRIRYEHSCQATDRWLQRHADHSVYCLSHPRATHCKLPLQTLCCTIDCRCW